MFSLSLPSHLIQRNERRGDIFVRPLVVGYVIDGEEAEQEVSQEICVHQGESSPDRPVVGSSRMLHMQRLIEPAWQAAACSADVSGFAARTSPSCPCTAERPGLA